MKRIELMKAVFDYLTGLKPFDQREEIATLRYVINLIEDYMNWEQILKHLTEGCTCKTLKGEEAKKALEADLEE